MKNPQVERLYIWLVRGQHIGKHSKKEPSLATVFDNIYCRFNVSKEIKMAHHFHWKYSQNDKITVKLYT